MCHLENICSNVTTRFEMLCTCGWKKEVFYVNWVGRAIFDLQKAAARQTCNRQSDTPGRLPQPWSCSQSLTTTLQRVYANAITLKRKASGLTQDLLVSKIPTVCAAYSCFFIRNYQLDVGFLQPTLAVTKLPVSWDALYSASTLDLHYTSSPDL